MVKKQFRMFKRPFGNKKMLYTVATVQHALCGVSYPKQYNCRDSNRKNAQIFHETKVNNLACLKNFHSVTKNEVSLPLFQAYHFLWQNKTAILYRHDFDDKTQKPELMLPCV